MGALPIVRSYQQTRARRPCHAIARMEELQLHQDRQLMMTSPHFLRATAGASAIVTTLLLCPVMLADERAATRPSTQPSAEVAEEWSRLMNRRLPELRFTEVEFGDCIDFFRDTTQISITVDWASIEAAGVTK